MAAQTEHLPNSKIIRTAPETQANSDWTPPGGALGDLVAAAALRAQGLRRGGGQPPMDRVPSFRESLIRDDVAVIAEIKRRSPSRGEINLAVESGPQALAYELGGAAAVSVLTEPSRFGGRNEDLEQVREASRLPILRKDFHVAEAQLEEAQNLGASAALLIVRAVEPSLLRDLAAAARELSLEIVFEVRDESELELALDAGGILIGVNNRNLETLEVDAQTVARLVPRIPPGCLAIAESGYSTRASVESAARAGADAVLVGSSLSASADPTEAVRRITGVRRIGRGGFGRSHGSVAE